MFEQQQGLGQHITHPCERGSADIKEPYRVHKTLSTLANHYVSSLAKTHVNNRVRVRARIICAREKQPAQDFSTYLMIDSYVQAKSDMTSSLQDHSLAAYQGGVLTGMNSSYA